MTVCVITTEGDVVCRGGNDTGLLGYGDREPRAGNHRIALPEAVYRLEIRQGDAYAMFGTDTALVSLWRWGGDAALAPVEWLPNTVRTFALGNMPMAGVADPTWPFFSDVASNVQAWGTPSRPVGQPRRRRTAVGGSHAVLPGRRHGGLRARRVLCG
jgi:hypothetical protein